VLSRGKSSGTRQFSVTRTTIFRNPHASPPPHGGRYHIPPDARPHDRRPARPPRPGHRPILAGIRSPRTGRKPAHRTRIDRDYETLRTGMQTLFHDLGITPIAAAA
jgi:hypothetical protein